MATAKHSSRNNSGRIAGALACLEALRAIERAANDFNPGETAASFYAARQADVDAFVDALGPMSPELRGAVEAIAEYIHINLTDGTPNTNPEGWLPVSAMLDSERIAMVEHLDAEHEADDLAIKNARKVVSIADWVATV